MNLSHHIEHVLGHKIHFVEAGPAAFDEAIDTMVFLHGFPEYWASWQNQLSYFCEKRRVIAPDLLGYNLSDKPQDDSIYQVPNLLKIYSQFVEKVNDGKPVVLVAHDWGGAIAWPLVAFYPHLFSKLVIVNAAHPSTFTREMINNPEQRAKSSYIHEMIAQDGEKTLEKDNFAFLRSMLFEEKLGDPLGEEVEQMYLDAWSQPGAINGMLAYYRSMPQLAAQENSEAEGQQGIPIEQIKIPQIRIEIPTLVLWGEKDKAFVPELLDGLGEFVPDIQIRRFPDASHWLHHEKPEVVNKAINDFIE